MILLQLHMYSFLYISNSELSAGAVVLGKRKHELEGESSKDTKRPKLNGN